MSYLGNPGSNKIITTDAGGKLVPGVVGSGMSLTAGTLTAGVTVAFDCDFSLLSNQSITGATVITDQESRSLTFTPSFVGTASMAIVNGSGLGLTTASANGRSRIFSLFSGFNRNPFFGDAYRIWMRWSNYTPLASTTSLYTGLYIDSSAGANNCYADNWRHNAYNIYSSTFPDGTYSINFSAGAQATYNVLVLEQECGMLTSFYGFSASGFPAYTSLRALGSGRSRALSSGIWQNTDLSGYGFEFQFANLADGTSRTMYCTNLRVETWL